MDLGSEFDNRIAAIHGFHNQQINNPTMGENTMDVRHAEFQAMADVFLGEEYDKTKLQRVESMQIALQELQAVFYHRYQSGEVSPDNYVDLFNFLLASIFDACETILGEDDFVKFFGASRSDVAGFIDKEAFLHSQESYTEPE